MTDRIDWPVTSDAEMVDALALFSPFKAWMEFAHIPRTAAPVRFRRVAIRKRDAWGTGWDHYSTSETFRYGY